MSASRPAAADVYKQGQLAATIRHDGGEIEFAYSQSYLQGDGPAVATTLPRTSAPVRTRGGAVPPFFAGLLPEGRRLSSLRRAIKTSADDELSLLLAVGSDTIGDVQVVPGGSAPIAGGALVQITRAWSEVHFSELLSDGGIADRVGIPGVQEKASARVISLPIKRAGERYLLKVDPPEYPHLVENEAFFLSRARGAKIPCADATVVRDADGRPGLLVRRFDRVAQPSGETLRLACEDACQVLARWPADKYNLTCEEVVLALADRCAARVVASRALFQQICFAWLTGNGDVHAKNLSILATPEGEWRVAPAYDLPSTVPYGDGSLALSLQGKVRGISRRRLLAFADAVGLPQRIAAATLDDVLKRTEGLEDLLRSDGPPFGPEVSTGLIKEVRHRRRLASP